MFYISLGAMAGRVSGAATRIRELYPKAVYVHCPSHRLNLCVAKSCSLPMVEEMMSEMEAISLFFYKSSPRSAVLDECISLINPEARHKIILNICRTRWIERLDALDVLTELYPSVFATFDKISLNEKREYSKKAVDKAKPRLKRWKNLDSLPLWSLCRRF